MTDARLKKVRFRTLGSRQMVVTRDANDQRPRGRHKCQVQVQLVLSCSCDEKQHTGTLVPQPTMEFQDACRRCRLAGSHLFLGWCLELTAAASAEQPSCAASPTLTLLLLRPFTQSPHRSRPRPSLCGSSYIHTYTRTTTPPPSIDL